MRLDKRRELIISELSLFLIRRQKHTRKAIFKLQLLLWMPITLTSTRRRRRRRRVARSKWTLVEEFVWVPISFTLDVNSERWTRCAVSYFRSFALSPPWSMKRAKKPECLINLLFIVVRSSSSDTSARSHHVCILIFSSTLRVSLFVSCD